MSNNYPHGNDGGGYYYADPRAHASGHQQYMSDHQLQLQQQQQLQQQPQQQQHHTFENAYDHQGLTQQHHQVQQHYAQQQSQNPHVVANSYLAYTPVTAQPVSDPYANYYQQERQSQAQAASIHGSHLQTSHYSNLDYYQQYNDTSGAANAHASIGNTHSAHSAMDHNALLSTSGRELRPLAPAPPRQELAPLAPATRRELPSRAPAPTESTREFLSSSKQKHSSLGKKKPPFLELAPAPAESLEPVSAPPATRPPQEPTPAAMSAPAPQPAMLVPAPVAPQAPTVMLVPAPAQAIVLVPTAPAPTAAPTALLVPTTPGQAVVPVASPGQAAVLVPAPPAAQTTFLVPAPAPSPAPVIPQSVAVTESKPAPKIPKSVVATESKPTASQSTPTTKGSKNIKELSMTPEAIRKRKARAEEIRKRELEKIGQIDQASISDPKKKELSMTPGAIRARQRRRKRKEAKGQRAEFLMEQEAQVLEIRQQKLIEQQVMSANYGTQQQQQQQQQLYSQLISKPKEGLAQALSPEVIALLAQKQQGLNPVSTASTATTIANPGLASSYTAIQKKSSTQCLKLKNKLADCKKSLNERQTHIRAIKENLILQEQLLVKANMLWLHSKQQVQHVPLGKKLFHDDDDDDLDDENNVSCNVNTMEIDEQHSVKVCVNAPPRYGKAAVANRRKRQLKDNRINDGTAAEKQIKHKNLTFEVERLAKEQNVTYLIKSAMHLEGPEHLQASLLPNAFPPELAFRALGAYSLLRSLSKLLRLSPFTPQAFLRCLSLPAHNKLSGDIHVSVLRFLCAHYNMGVYQYRGDALSKAKRKIVANSMANKPKPRQIDEGTSDYLLRAESLFTNAGENLIYLDEITWPLYYCDYIQVHLQKLKEDEMMEKGEEDLPQSASTILSDDLLHDRNLDHLFKSQPGELVESERSNSGESLKSTGKESARDEEKNPDSTIAEGEGTSPIKIESDELNSTGNDPSSQKQQSSDSCMVKKGDNPPIKVESNGSLHDIYMQQGPSGSQNEDRTEKANKRKRELSMDESDVNSLGKEEKNEHNNEGNDNDDEWVSEQTTKSDSPLKKKPKPSGQSPIASNHNHGVQNGNFHQDQNQMGLSYTHPTIQSYNASPYGEPTQNIIQQSVAPNCIQPPFFPVPQYYPPPPGPWSSYDPNSNISHRPPYPVAVGAAYPQSMNSNYSQNQNPSHNPKPSHDHKPSHTTSKPKYMSQNPDARSVSYNVKESVDNYLVDQLDKKKAESTENTLKETEKESTSGGKEYLLQTAPYEQLQNDVPYHSLSVESKLSILEYILDELLETEIVSKELAKRHDNTIYNPHLYGKCPEASELDDIINNDECAVCGYEGDLLCCDGCTSSYHRHCIDIPLYKDLGEGKWLCPECSTNDGSKLGPLYGGKKSSIDWFSFSDIHIDDEDSNGADLGAISSFAKTEFMIISGFVFIRKSETRESVDFDKLVSAHKSSPSETPKNEEHKTMAKIEYTPLTAEQVFSLLSILGPDLSASWPWCQIPFHPRRVWKDLGLDVNKNNAPTTNDSELPSEDIKSSNRVVSKRTLFNLKNSENQWEDFMSSIQNFDPNKYVNKYHGAPVTPTVKAHVGKHITSLQDTKIETEPVHFNLSRNTNLDKFLSSCLEDRTFYDVLNPARRFMLKLENSLSRASLLHEFWGTRNQSRNLNWWNKQVSSCKSVKALATLLVRLIDDTRSRAFVEEWNRVPCDMTSPWVIQNDSFTLNPLPYDWKIKDEVSNKIWRECLDSDLLGLLKEKLRRSKSARKRKTSSQSTKVNGQIEIYQKQKVEDKNEDAAFNVFEKEKKSEKHSSKEVQDLWNSLTDVERQSYVKETQSIPGGKGIDSLEEEGSSNPSRVVNNPRKSRRRNHEPFSNRPERPVGKTVLHQTLVSILGWENDVTIEKEDVVYNLEKLLLDSHSFQDHWPVAGRKLFIPQGSLTQNHAKWLGRNAGCKIAPNTVYSTRAEVGISSVKQIWRSRVLNCYTVEALVHQIKFLDSYLNKNVINSLESMTRRMRSSQHHKKHIKYTLRTNGVEEYFVVNEKGRGCWFFEENLDLSACVSEFATRIKSRRQMTSERDRTALAEEMNRKQVRDLKFEMKVLKSKLKFLETQEVEDKEKLEEIAVALEEEERKKLENEKAAAVAAAAAARPSPQTADVAMTARPLPQATTVAMTARPLPPATTVAMTARPSFQLPHSTQRNASEILREIDQDVIRIMQLHSERAVSIMRDCKSMGLKTVPGEALQPAREKFMEVIMSMNSKLLAAGKTPYAGRDMLQQAEIDAALSFKKEVKDMKK